MFRRSNVGTRHQNSPTAMSRRAAVAAMAAVPLSVQLSVYPAVADDAVADLIKAAGEKNAAFMRGDMEGWAKLVRIAPDFTLMQPFGGLASRGYDTSPSGWHSSRTTSRTARLSWRSLRPMRQTGSSF